MNSFSKRSSIVILLAAVVFVSTHCKTGVQKTKKVKKYDGVDILFCGDIMLDWGIKTVIDKYGFDYPLKRMKELLLEFDFRFCNLECPLSEEGEPHVDKKYIFLGEPQYIQLLINGYIDGVTLANNHSCDFGEIALMNTMTNLSFSGIQYTGAGIDSETARLPILIEKKNVRVAIFGYSTIALRGSYATTKNPGIAKASLSLIRRDIQKFRRFNDFIVISLHWGIEYSDYPTEKQIDMAHNIIDCGADVIIGHHPHIYQGIEIYKGKPIIYSLGNYIFGSINEDVRDNIMVSIRFTKESIDLLRVIPINGNREKENRFQYHVLSREKAGDLFSHLKFISKPLNSDFSESAVQNGFFLEYRFASLDEKRSEKNTEKSVIKE